MRDIKGYEGLYAVTSCGKVWSYRSKKFLKPFKTGGNYLGVILCKSNKEKHYSIHRLVAEAYIPNPENLPQVNHKDENKTHNYIRNLEWCTHEYNQNYGSHNGMAKSKMKYKFIKCLEIDKIYTNYNQISEELNINRKNIMYNMTKAIEMGWSLGGYHFEAVEG